jgi:hypothetical protein
MTFLALCAALVASAAPVPAEGIPAKYRPTVARGLAWLARQQHKDGHWEAAAGQYPTPMTALAGVALLLEGSTLREGTYRANLRRAADWLVKHTQPSGLIGNPTAPAEGSRYMYGHGFGMLFLACAAGDLEEGPQRRRLLRVLKRAVRYARDAQTPRGGWGYVSARDGGNFDEGSTTLTVLHGLRAARLAGVVAARAPFEAGRRYLEKATTARGGVIYSLAYSATPSGGTAAAGSERPALTAGAIVAAFEPRDYDKPVVKKWLKYCHSVLPAPGTRRALGHDAYTFYYYSQAVHCLGDRWEKLFPDSRPAERLTWAKYRTALYDTLHKSQAADGSWSGSDWTARGIGPVYVTALHLTVLQLDNATVPLFQR